jgi:DNA-binding cell septation regulator SpoVG
MASATATITATAARIEVIALSAVSAGNLKAFASVRIGPSLVVHKCRVIQQPGQRAWVSMPQERWEGSDGKPHSMALVEVTGPCAPGWRRPFCRQRGGKG